jgi:hypothetical protein
VAARYSAPVQTGLGVHTACCTMGNWVKRPGRGVNHPQPSRAEVQERVELYLYSPPGPSWPVLGRPLPFLGSCSEKTVEPSAHVATQKKLIGHANYQPVTSELLPLKFNGSNSPLTGG